MNGPVILNRRRVLAGGGALIVSFSLGSAFAQDQAAPAPAQNPPGSLKQAPLLDSWIRIDADGSITAFTGKAELGQGFRTAFQQIAAEELDVAFASLKVVTADTKLTANEGYTSGSNSMKDSGTAVQNAAAQVRELLVAEAARRLGQPIENFRTENGEVIAPDGRRLRYGDLVASELLHVQAQPKSKLKDPATFRVMGLSVPASIFQPRSPAARPMSRTSGCPECCTPESCARRATARSCRSAIPRRSKNCPAWSRSCAMAISSPWSPRRNFGRSRR
jgi:CO/xanthine dehydrogenase Mo-binding subunit